MDRSHRSMISQMHLPRFPIMRLLYFDGGVWPRVRHVFCAWFQANQNTLQMFGRSKCQVFHTPICIQGTSSPTWDYWQLRASRLAALRALHPEERAWAQPLELLVHVKSTPVVLHLFVIGFLLLLLLLLGSSSGKDTDP